MNESWPSQPNDDMYDSGAARTILNERLEMSRKTGSLAANMIQCACRGRHRGDRAREGVALGKDLVLRISLVLSGIVGRSTPF